VRGESAGALGRISTRSPRWWRCAPSASSSAARLKRGYTGGAPLGPDVFRFFHAIGVNLKQIYGQTEICGIAVVHPTTT
jgi:long-chain acyl-CoA synthetase